MKTPLSLSSGLISHRLLRRQVRRIFGKELAVEGEWAELLDAVNDAYHEADREKQLVENALEINAQELTEANIKLRLLIDNAPAGIVMLDSEMRCIFASRRWLQDRHVKLQDIVGKAYGDIVPEMANHWEDVLRRCQAGATESCEEDPIPQSDGSVEWIKWEIRPWRETNGLLGGIIVMSEDITARKRAEDQLRVAAVAFQSRDGMIVTDANGVILQVNEAFTAVTGYSPEEAMGKTPRLLRSDKQDAAFYRNMWEALAHEGCWSGDIWNRRKDGGIYPEWLSISGIKDSSGQVTHYLGIYSDIREPKEAERRILELAFYDPLTGLPNRRLLLDRLNHAQANTAREHQFGALLLLDLDDFKTLNDTRGHDVGDQLLIEVARRLSETLRESDSAARLGGDEFVILLEGLSQDQARAATKAEVTAEKIRAAVSRPVILDDKTHYTTPSIGVTLFRGHGDTSDALLRQADLALYQAKDAGRNAIRFYSPRMQALVDGRAQIETGLRRALANEEFILHYQPQIDRNGRLVAAEALLRWQQPGQAPVSPNTFIPVAEESGLIVPIGFWVLQSVCDLLARLDRDPNAQQIQLSINISARQFHHSDFVDEVKFALQRSGARPERLMFELTESLLLKNIDNAIQTMVILKNIGIGFAIDDFGVGYSSLAYLKRLPLDQIKIDQSFVRDVIDSPDDQAIVQAIISLAHSLSLRVIAEGVETEAQKDFLASNHCDAFQGFLFSRPVPMEELLRLIK